MLVNVRGRRVKKTALKAPTNSNKIIICWCFSCFIQIFILWFNSCLFKTEIQILWLSRIKTKMFELFSIRLFHVTSPSGCCCSNIAEWIMQ